MSISVGTRVRSFDFTSGPESRALSRDRACYVEGHVVGLQRVGGCDRYCILVDRDIFGGEEEDRRVGDVVYPPVNGTPTWSGEVTDYVEVVS